MFRTSATLLTKQVRIRVSAYGLFMRRTRNHPALQGLTFHKRAVTLAKMWKQLSTQEKAAIGRSAKKYGVFVEAPRPTRRGTSKYHAFVKKNIGQFKGVKAQTQLKLVADLWRAQKKQ